MSRHFWEMLAGIPDASIFVVLFLVSMGGLVLLPGLMPIVASVLALGLSLVVTARLRVRSQQGHDHEGFWVRALRSPLFPLVPFFLILAGSVMEPATPGAIYLCLTLPGILILGLQLWLWYGSARRTGKNGA